MDLHHQEVAEVRVQDFMKFLAATQIGCPFCEKGEYRPVSYRQRTGIFKEEETGIAMASVMEFGAGGENIFAYGYVSSFMVIPALCNHCGNVQVFSLGDVLGYLEASDDGK